MAVAVQRIFYNVDLYLTSTSKTLLRTVGYNSMKTNATLVDVRGDVCEFADLIGESVVLCLSKGNNWFAPQGNEWVEFRKKRVTRKDNRIRVRTDLGNTFVFEVETL